MILIGRVIGCTPKPTTLAPFAQFRRSVWNFTSCTVHCFALVLSHGGGTDDAHLPLFDRLAEAQK
jgi:hypothetical protein